VKITDIVQKNKVLFFGLLLSLFLSLIFFLLSLIFPRGMSEKYNEKSLRQLKSKKQSIQKEFAAVLEEIQSREASLKNSPFPEDEAEIFSLFKTLTSHPEIEGIGYYNRHGDAILWLGNVADVREIFSAGVDTDFFIKKNSSLLVKNKASSYLLNIHRVGIEQYVILYRLLAFQPELKSPYLTEYHFLRAQLLKNCDISYMDFQEDVSGFANFFARHDDEYIGEPTSPDNILTLIFPLRNEDGRIISTVNLSSPPMPSDATYRQQDFLLLFYVLFGISFVFFLLLILKTFPISQKQNWLAGSLIILTLIGLRLIFFPISQLEKIQNLSIFSPSTASFFSFWGLTKSPADIFLSAVCIFLIFGYLLIPRQTPLKQKTTEYSFPVSLSLNALFVLIPFVLLFIFQKFLYRLVHNSNLNLLRFSFKPSFLLIHLSILLFFLVIIFCTVTGLKSASRGTKNLFLPSALFLIFLILSFFLQKNTDFLLILIQAFIIFLCLLRAYLPNTERNKGFFFAFILLSTLFVFIATENSTTSRHRLLIQSTVKNTIQSQRDWGLFLIRQTLPEIDLREESIRSFFHTFEPSNLAHSLWGMSHISKFNWYSSLELLDPNEAVLARFSLNVPEYSRINTRLPQSLEWKISSYKVPFLGQEKDFLLAYKDFYEQGTHLGRIVIYLSLDYDMLPFLYSANPYFELLRVSSLPSLNELDFGFAVYDSDGRLLFNPYNISSGIAPDFLQKIQMEAESQWSSFTEDEKPYSSFYFKDNDKIYSLFLPRENFLDYSVEYLELLFLYTFFTMILFLLFSVSLRKKKIVNPFWSFSSRVYVSFVAVALIPFILFIILTRTFFDQIFTQQITERAEYQAKLAQRVMDDFFYSQQQEQLSLTLPPDDVVFWISSTIANDVNIYLDGRLISSSRREFFDYGLLPDLINGNIHFKMQYESIPFYTQTQKIGNYSFQTLTVSYPFEEGLLLLSLPFPLQQQEISEATEELIEFLILISIFFVAAVLLFARGIGGMIITPIRKLIAGTKEVSLGNLKISIPHKHQDEMKTLIDGFNTMIRNLKQHQQDLADMSKKVAWAEIARKVAHEIKNPLTPIQLSAEHLLNVYKDNKENFEDALEESTSYIINEVENLRRIAHEFLETSKEAALQKDILDLKDIITETLGPYKNILSKRIRIEESYAGEDFRFTGDKVKIKIALRNIFTNAIEAIHDQGRIHISLTSQTNNLKLVIQDSGIGMSQDMLARIFEPYFSTKDVGTGLGLPIAKKIIEDHDGTIEAASEENVRTTIRVTLPKIEPG
jgi:signal transduction histidine kinase